MLALRGVALRGVALRGVARRGAAALAPPLSRSLAAAAPAPSKGPDHPIHPLIRQLLHVVPADAIVDSDKLEARLETGAAAGRKAEGR
jgi:hypothetical protein